MDRFSPRLAASLIEDRHREAADIRRVAALRAGAARPRATWWQQIRHRISVARERAGRLPSGGHRSLAPQEGHM